MIITGMKNISNNFKASWRFPLIIALAICANVSIYFNIPVLDIVLGTIFLSFIPGILILSILKLDHISLAKFVLLCIGLSLFVLMIVGLLTNNLALAIGWETPLDKIFLMFVINFLALLLSLLNYMINGNRLLLPNYSFLLKNKFIVFWLIFPCLAVVGSYYMRFKDNNSISLFGFIFIILIITIFVLIRDKLNPSIFPISIYFMGLFITLIFSLRSDYIIGADVHSEYYLFRLAITNLNWKIFDYSALDACLGISILPAIYKQMLNINDLPQFFKIFYSVIIPMTPVAVFEIAKKYLGNFQAFLAAIFFLSSHVFMWTGANARSNLAVFFFSLAVMVLFMNISHSIKKLLFLAFILATLFSHYSTTYVFFVILLFVWLLDKILFHEFDSKRNQSLGLILLFFVMIFLWYSQVTSGAFDYSAVGFVKHTLNSMGEIFLVESRGGAMPEVLGVGFLHNMLPRQIHIVTQWVVIILIVIGLISSIRISIFKLDFMKCSQNKILDLDYTLFSIACFGILIFCVLNPVASTSLGTDRTYYQMMAVLSIIFIKGCSIVSKFIKINANLVLLFVIIPYFMCGTGILYQFYDMPNEPTFNSKGNLFYTYYLQDHHLDSAEWIYNKRNESVPINTLTKSGTRALKDISRPGKSFIYRDVAQYDLNKVTGYLHFDKQAVINGVVLANRTPTNMSYFSAKLEKKDELYDNGGSEIYLWPTKLS